MLLRLRITALIPGVSSLTTNTGSFARLHLISLTGALSAMAFMFAPLPALSQASQGAEDASGQQAFNNACRTCHMVREGDNRLGPNLHRIVGRQAGSLPDYGFSSALKEAGFVWDEDKLDRFIANPDEVVPGNSMKPYGGLSSGDERKRIIGFLAQSR